MHIAQLFRIRLQAALACLWLALAFPPQSGASERSATPVWLTLVGRTTEVPAQVALREDEWRWLRSKRVLRIGVAQPSFVPMEVIRADMHYEGVTADVLGAVGKLLQLDVQVLDYTDRAAALAALQRNEVDLVGSANTYELGGNAVQLTRPYVDDTPVLYVRKAETRAMANHLTGMRIATAENYLPQVQLAERYPGARFIKFPSREQALSALAFGSADLYLGDAISSNYLVNLSYFNYVRPYATLDLQTGGFSFAVRSDATRLRSLLDAALVVVREHHSTEMLRRWSGGGAAVSSEKVELSAAEQRWISRNPVVRFVTSNDAAPFSYFDSGGRFSGISADILREVTARTGLEFQPVRAGKLAEHMAYLESGQADLTGLIRTDKRAERLHFSRAIVDAPFAIITRSGSDAVADIDDLQGKRIALPAAHALRELLHPADRFDFIESESTAAALEMVARGEADATAAFLPIAQYYISTLHDGKLQVSNIIEGTPSGLSFASRREDVELASILEKALLQIPPDEIDVFQNRWRPSADISQAGWQDYRGLILQIGGVAFLLILISLAWNLHIRSQYRRRQRAEDALGEQLNLMESLINGTPHAIYVRDREARMVTCNANYLEVFGATRDAVLGRTALEGVKLDGKEAQQFHQDYLWVMENRKPLEVDRTLHLPGRILSIYHWIHPYCDSQGQVKGVISGWIDVSERRLLMEELRAARDVANESSRAKTTFLATMSHEIRTPMSAVIGMLELALKRAEKGRFDKGAVEVAYDSARGLLELIGDILDVVRIESGHASLSPQRANLLGLVESVTRVFDGLARQKALTLTTQLDAAVDCDVLVDPLRFKQVLSNLVGNAIKFTDHGEVRVSVEAKPLADSRLLVQLRVRDTGIGIEQAELATLFEPFAQADHGRTVRGGTGLGLPICRSLCELMGGHIAVASSKGQGTCVTVEVPLSVLPGEAVTKPEMKPAALHQHPRMQVLVVDDQQANRVLLSQQLEYFGQTVYSAQNGEEGMALWREHPIDVVITDCNMPVMNGYDMARAIREEEADAGIPPCAIIGFTANAQPEEKGRCLDAGMDDCLFKPVSLTAISATLSTLSGMPNVVLKRHPVPVVEEISFEEVLRELTGGDHEMMRLLIDEACHNYVNDGVELEEHTVNVDPKALANLVHRIKGGARIVQQHTITAACSRVERLCESVPMDTAAIVSEVKLIQQELAALVVRLDAYRNARVLAS